MNNYVYRIANCKVERFELIKETEKSYIVKSDLNQSGKRHLPEEYRLSKSKFDWFKSLGFAFATTCPVEAARSVKQQVMDAREYLDYEKQRIDKMLSDSLNLINMSYEEL